MNERSVNDNWQAGRTENDQSETIKVKSERKCETGEVRSSNSGL